MSGGSIREYCPTLGHHGRCLLKSQVGLVRSRLKGQLGEYEDLESSRILKDCTSTALSLPHVFTAAARYGFGRLLLG